MEELRSTAIIDSEILEDSRKKAERILANSKNECEQILASVSGKVAEITKEKQSLYDEKISAFRRDRNASLPLERKRYLVEFEQKQMQQAIIDYLSTLSVEKKLTLIANLFKRYVTYIGDSKVSIYVVGFDCGEIKKIVESELPKDAILECKEITSAYLSSVHTKYGSAEGMIIETEDKSRMFRVFIGELIEQIIDKKSYELASTLFCGRLPE